MPVKRYGFTDDPVRQCEGKTKYLTKKRAKVAKARMHSHPGRGRLRIYRCPHCGFFHFGNDPS